MKSVLYVVVVVALLPSTLGLLVEHPHTGQMVDLKGASGNNTCELCTDFVALYEKWVDIGNSTAEECIRLGQRMCHLIDPFGKVQREVCDAVVNATTAIKNLFVSGIVLPHDICQKLGFCDQSLGACLYRGKKALGYVAAKSNNVCWQFPGADCPEPLCSTPANKTQVICDKGQCAVGPLQCAQTVALSELCQSKTFETCKFM
jgi:hypothetical protein|uniref:Saposin B-type domain-containing protein n=1 Tax=Eutreptiella gymnastica TaxID=73025 RepID=A0A7S4FEM1_9EUGL